MKKLNLLLLSMVCLTACLFVGCAEKQAEIDGPVQMKSMELGLEISKADLQSNKFGAIKGNDDYDPENDVPYCDEDVQAGDVAVALLKLTFDGDVEARKTSGKPNGSYEVWAWKVDEETNGLERLSELKQIDFYDGETKVDIVIEDFRVYDNKAQEADFSFTTENGKNKISNSGTGILKFITPMIGSAYEGYVSTPVEKEFTVDLYEKQYMKMQVLCFNEEDVPFFGFAWSDFEVITGDEICMFFNCLGTAAQSRHQVLAAEVKAYFWTKNNVWEDYWAGANYSYYVEEGEEEELGNVDLPLEIEPFCIPCPGNWKAEHENGNGGFKIEVMPKDGSDVITIYITENQIQAFLDENAAYTEREAADEKGWLVLKDNGEKEASAEIALADGVPFIHYTLEDCYKPKAYYSNLLGQGYNKVSDIYALTWGENPTLNFEMKKIFTVSDHNHIAMTPDESKLILVSETGKGWGANISVYDIYSLKSVNLTFVVPDPDENEHDPTMTYRFTQLVYIEDQLYGGCNDLNCLVPININLDNNTFTYGEDIVQMKTTSPNVKDVSGGDLLGGTESKDILNLYSFTKAYDGAIIRYWEIEEGTSAKEKEISVPSELIDVTGVCLISNKKGAITSSTSNVDWDAPTPGSVSFTYWSNGTQKSITIEDLDSYGGDMASAFNPCTNEQLKTIFNINF